MSATPLGQLATVVRSKNAGPFELTFDVLFTEHDVYRRVCDSGALTAESLAARYRVSDDDVSYCAFFEPALAFKLTIIRRGNQGSIGERDTFGAQQHAPLLDMPIPEVSTASSSPEKRPTA